MTLLNANFLHPKKSIRIDELGLCERFGEDVCILVLSIAIL